MRRLVLLFLVAGCGTPPEPVTQAVVTGVVVDALPLDQPWDGALRTNPPDVYVDVVDGAPPGPLGYRSVLVRTGVSENVTALMLPLRLRAGTSTPLSVRAPLRIVVADRDMGGFDDDDDLFVAEVGSLASRVRDAVPGDSSTLTFGSDRTRIRMTVRWQ